MDALDKIIVNRLQSGIEICERPFLALADELAISEERLLKKIDNLIAKKVLSRFGPMFNAERFGGHVTLAAMKVPEGAFDKTTEIVNKHSAVAHNYRREHDFNMWFVVSDESESAVLTTLKSIEKQTGYPVYNMPKKEEFYVGLKLAV